MLYKVTLKDGSGALGIRVGETAEELKFALPGGNVTAVKKSELKETVAVPGSLMPAGLLSSLSEQEVKDLMSFLLTKP